MSPRLARLLALFTLTSCGIALAGRMLARGRYYAGWDIIFSTQGYFTASTQSLGRTLARMFEHGGPPNVLSAPLDSIAVVLVPGYLARLWPWDYWAHTVTFALVAVTLWLIARAAGLPRGRRWIVLLAWGTSPALVSFALVGFPWATAFLPHALALWVILDRRFHHGWRAWVVAPLLCALALALSWQLWDLGKTVFTVFLAAAFLVRGAPLGARVLWLVTGGAQLWAVFAWPTGVAPDFMKSDLASVTVLASAARTVANAFVGLRLDLPVLLGAGLVALLGIRRDRLLVLAMLAVQLGLVVVLAAANSYFIRPRRFLMVEYYCVVAVALAFRDAVASRGQSFVRALLLVALVVGNLWQLANLVQFAREERVPRAAGVRFPLPYTFSQADYMVPYPEVDLAADMVAAVESGERLIVVYNFSTYSENLTNPTAVLERVYLRLGHDRFVRSVFVFGSAPCRFACLPIRPLDTIDKVLDQIRPGGPIDPTRVRLYYSQDVFPTYQHIFEWESAMVFSAVRRRFALEQESPPGAKVLRFRLVPRPPDALQGFRIAEPSGACWRTVGGAIEVLPFPWNGGQFERYWVQDAASGMSYVVARPWGANPLTVGLRGVLQVEEGGAFQFLLGGDERVALAFGGRVVLEAARALPWGYRFDLAQRTFALGPGRYPFEVTYEDRDTTAHLVFDVYRVTPGTITEHLPSVEPSQEE